MMGEREHRAAGWTVEDHLAFDIGFALPRAPIRGLRRALAQNERHAIATAIVEHLRLCGWVFRLPPPSVGHRAGRGGLSA
jgi:hypothetical protein